MNPFDRYLKPENCLQISVCRYIALQYPKAAVHHSPMEGKRTKFEQYLLKRMGSKSGFPDLFIMCNKSVLVLELKIGRNKPTDNQKWWLDAFAENGISSHVCYTFDDAKEIIDNWMRGQV